MNNVVTFGLWFGRRFPKGSVAGCNQSRYTLNNQLLAVWVLVKLQDTYSRISLTFHGTQRFITLFAKALHLAISWAKSIQLIWPHPSSKIQYYLSAYVYVCIPLDPFPSGFLTKISCAFLFSPWHAHSYTKPWWLCPCCNLHKHENK
jgi:hypothetical protein